MSGAILEIDRGVGRNERSQIRVLGAAWRQAAGGDEGVARRQGSVEARERAEPAIDPVLILGEAGDFGGVVTILSGLFQRQTILDERPAELQPRREHLQPYDLEVLPALGPEARIEIVDPQLPAIAAALGAQHHEP